MVEEHTTPFQSVKCLVQEENLKNIQPHPSIEQRLRKKQIRPREGDLTCLKSNSWLFGSITTRNELSWVTFCLFFIRHFKSHTKKKKISWQSTVAQA
jgi:hypothetical protein